MPALFDKFGIRFQYPENWTLEIGADADQEGVTVYSPGGGFWSVVLRGADDDPAEVARLALVALDDVYDELDCEPVAETIAGQETVGFDVNFYCLDLTNTAQIRAIESGGRSYLLLCQAEDREFEQIGSVFRAMTTSLLSGMPKA